MAKYRRKVVEVEAHRYDGAGTHIVMHDLKGQQAAKKGDWLVGSERGQIEVVKDEDFQRDFELHGLADAPEVDAAVASTGSYAGISRKTKKG